VGAGAIGCELLKGFALVGLGAGASGGVTVADMDHIERSNLSRQFLFRTQDVGRPKAEVAAEATHRLNSDLRVTPLTYALDHTTEHIYEDNFFSRVDGVAAALDSFRARECLTLNLSPLFKAVPAPLLTLRPLARPLCGCSLHPLSEATAGGGDTGHLGPCFRVRATCD